MSQPPVGPATTPGKLAASPVATAAEKLRKEPPLAQLCIPFKTVSRGRIGSRKLSPKQKSLGHEESHPTQGGRAALSSSGIVLQRGHPSRLPGGSWNSALTGPGRAPP